MSTDEVAQQQSLLQLGTSLGAVFLSASLAGLLQRLQLQLLQELYQGNLEKGSSGGALGEPEPFCAAAGGATKTELLWLLLHQGVKGRSGPLLVRASVTARPACFHCVCGVCT
jgi:hypothetical protein